MDMDNTDDVEDDFPEEENEDDENEIDKEIKAMIEPKKNEKKQVGRPRKDAVQPSPEIQANTQIASIPMQQQLVEVPRVISIEQMFNMIYDRQEVIIAVMKSLIKQEEK